MEILSVTIPILVFVYMGYVLKQQGFILENTRDFLSKLVYYFAFPALTFRSIVSFSFADTFKLKLVAHNMLVTTAAFFLAFFLAFLIKDKKKRGSFNMGCFRSNQGYIGLPVIRGFYGEGAMSKAAVVNGFDSLAVIVLSVFALEIFKEEKKAGEKSGLLETLVIKFKNFITNPFIISSMLGLFISYAKIPILDFKILDEILRISANMALPLAVMSVGCSIELRHLKENLKLIISSVAIKLLLVPFIAFILAYYVFQFRGDILGISVIALSTPSAVSSYIMASEMGADKELSADIIGITTFFSVFSISLVQYILKTFVL